MARKLRWTDVHDIAIELEEAHPEADNVNLRFTDPAWPLSAAARRLNSSRAWLNRVRRTGAKSRRQQQRQQQ